MATITANPSFNAEATAKELRDAMKGLGTNEKKIIEALTTISNAQRQEARHKFKVMYGRDLIEDLKSELGGQFEDAILALVQEPAEYDAHSLRSAMKGAGTDETVISEILASRSNTEIAAIKAKYAEIFKRDLEKDVMSETGGHLKRIYVSLLAGGRGEGPADQARAKADAEALYKAGEKKWGTDESEFNRVFATASAAQVRAVCEEYRAISSYDLAEVIRKEMSGNLEFAYLALLESARNKPKFFAERCHKAMKGMGTDEKTLIRAIVSRAEIDLQQVKKEFIDKYNIKLYKMVKDELSGDLERVMLQVLKD